MKKLCFCAIVLGMLLSCVTAVNATWTEDWSYSDRDPLAVSSYPKWYESWNYGDNVKVVTAGGPGGSNFIHVDEILAAAGDSNYNRDTQVPVKTDSRQTVDPPLVGDPTCNYAAEYASDPIIRIEMAVSVGAVGDHAYFSLGDMHQSWWGPSADTRVKQAFSWGIMGRDGGQVWLYDAAGNPVIIADEPTGMVMTDWTDYRMDIEKAANGGNGSASIWCKPSGDPTWIAIPELTDVNLNLLSAHADIQDPDDWTGMNVRAKRSGAAIGEPGTWNETDALCAARIGTITIEGVPEPMTMVLLGLGGLAVLRRRK